MKNITWIHSGLILPRQLISDGGIVILKGDLGLYVSKLLEATR